MDKLQLWTKKVDFSHRKLNFKLAMKVKSSRNLLYCNYKLLLSRDFWVISKGKNERRSPHHKLILHSDWARLWQT